MRKEKREKLFQSLADKCKCPECGYPNLIVYIAYCYDPECCGDTDRINCDRFGCHWELNRFFDEYEADTFIGDMGLILKEEK